jgi:hypothetical protein
MSIVRCISGALVLLTAAGCGSDLASVEGLVTLDGAPISGGGEISGTVRYYLAEGGGAPAVGRIDGSGRYALKTGGQDGIQPGAYLVAVTVKKIKPPTTPGGMPRADFITPPRYASVTQSGLREMVQSGSNTINFELSSQ